MWVSNLALKGSHTGSVNDNSTLASLVWFILAHLTSNQSDYIESAYEIHIDNSLEVLQGMDLVLLFMVCLNGHCNSCTVDSHIYTAKLFFCYSQSCLYLLLRGHICWGKYAAFS